MLDAVPLARARRIVADRDRQARAIGKALQFPFPQPQSRTVAAPRIGRDPQVRGRRVGRTTHAFPPTADGVHREVGGVVVDADADPALVAAQVVDPVGNRLALGRDDEVVDLHALRLALRTPLATHVLEVADQLLLLGVHRNDRAGLGPGPFGPGRGGSETGRPDPGVACLLSSCDSPAACSRARATAR